MIVYCVCRILESRLPMLFRMGLLLGQYVTWATLNELEDNDILLGHTYICKLKKLCVRSVTTLLPVLMSSSHYMVSYMLFD